MKTHEPLDMETSLIMSGVEVDIYWDIAVKKCGVKTVLTSYQYLKNKPKDFLKKKLADNPDVKVFIDSGAHTFFKDMEGYAKKPKQYWDDYLKEYTDFARENKDYIFAIANLDIGQIVGEELEDSWNDEIFVPLEQEGIQVCYIWHSFRGEQAWEEYAKKYSYIGLSNDFDATIQRLTKMTNITKKYNTRIHGMAFTKIELLTRVPLFTVDSTTWLVGQQYGELNFFNGRKMERLSKRQWQTQAKGRLIKPPYNADWDKLMTGGKDGGINTYELTRLNGIAYMEAQEYIRSRLKNKMYWLPLNSARNQAKSSGGLKLNKSTTTKPVPTREWFDGECNDYERYARDLNISLVDYPKEDIIDILKFFYAVLNDDMDFIIDEYTHEGVILYAEQVSDSQYESLDDAIEYLKEYFSNNANGSRHDFLGENESLERDRYVEEDEFTVVDLSADDLALPPPSEMPEVDELDSELASKGVVAIRDEKGRFLKGQKKVRKPKNVYSEKYPKLVCNNCYKSGDCPQFKAGYVCAFDRMMKRFDSRNYEDVVDAMASMVNNNLERMQRAMMFETMDGGFITPEVTGLIDQNMRLLEKMQGLQSNKPKPVLSQTRIVNSDGSEHTTTQVEVGSDSGGGILEKIFGNSNSNSKFKEEDVVEVDVDYVEQ